MQRTNKKLLDNITHLFLLQGFNYLLPLITLPYLVRVLGPEKFGLIAFAQSVIQYFILLTDYGFNLSGTRQIAIHRNDPNKVASIFSTIMTIKLGLMVLSFLVLAALILTVPQLGKEKEVYLVVFLMVIGNCLFPLWYFQGTEQMRQITFLNMFSKTLASLSVFVLVRNSQDYLWAAGLQSGGWVVTGILGLWVVHRKMKIKLCLPSYSEIVLALREGWHVFISTASISLYTTSNVLVLGFVTNPTTVGYFSAADKLIKAVQGVLAPITQSIYPHISSLAHQSKQLAIQFISKSLKWIGGASFLFSLVLFIFAKEITFLVLGPQYEASISLVRWMAFLPFIIGLSNIFGIQTMLTFGLNKEFSKILLVSGLFNLAIIFPLVHFQQAQGAAISVFITEFLVTALMAMVLKKKKIYLISLRESTL